MPNFNKDNDAQALIAAAQAISEKDLFAFKKAVGQLTLDIDFSQIMSRDVTPEYNAFSDLDLLEKLSHKLFAENNYPKFYQKFIDIKLSRDYPKKISQAQIDLWREFYSLVENSILEPLATELSASHSLFDQLKNQLWLRGMLQCIEHLILENSQVKNNINALHDFILQFNNLLTVLSIGCDNLFDTFYKQDVPRQIADLTLANEILTLHILKIFIITELKLPEENILSLKNLPQVLVILNQNLHHERFNSTFLELQVSRYIYIQNLLARINLTYESIDKETFEQIFSPILDKVITLYRFINVDELDKTAAHLIEVVTSHLLKSTKISAVEKVSVKNSIAKEWLDFLREIAPSSSVLPVHDAVSQRLLQKAHFGVIPDFSDFDITLKENNSNNKQSVEKPKSPILPQVAKVSEKPAVKRPRSQRFSGSFNWNEEETKNSDESSSLLSGSVSSSKSGNSSFKLSALRKKIPFLRSTGDIREEERKEQVKKDVKKNYLTMGSINQDSERERDEEHQNETINLQKR